MVACRGFAHCACIQFLTVTKTVYDLFVLLQNLETRIVLHKLFHSSSNHRFWLLLFTTKKQCDSLTNVVTDLFSLQLYASNAAEFSSHVSVILEKNDISPKLTLVLNKCFE